MPHTLIRAPDSSSVRWNGDAGRGDAGQARQSVGLGQEHRGPVRANNSGACMDQGTGFSALATSRIKVGAYSSPTPRVESSYGGSSSAGVTLGPAEK